MRTGGGLNKLGWRHLKKDMLMLLANEEMILNTTEWKEKNHSANLKKIGIKI